VSSRRARTVAATERLSLLQSRSVGPHGPVGTRWCSKGSLSVSPNRGFIPKNVRGAKDLLGQSSFGTTEKHYTMAQSRSAGRALAGLSEGDGCGARFVQERTLMGLKMLSEIGFKGPLGCSRMIRSHARQRTTPWSAAIGPSSTIQARKALWVALSLGGIPGEAQTRACDRTIL
jgi:hypothetical protein